MLAGGLVALLFAFAAAGALAREAYVANEGDGTVSVLDLANASVVGGPLGTGAEAGMVAITPDGAKAYVANHGADTVSVIDTATHTVLGDPIAVGAGPRGIAVTPDGARLYVANEAPLMATGTVSVIDTATDEVIGDPIAVDSTPRAIAISPDGRSAYVGGFLSESVSVIDTATDEVLGDPIAVGERPQGIAFTPDGAKAYVANLGSGDVSVIDTAMRTTVASIPVGSLPVGVAISPDGARAYVANAGTDTVSVIDTATDEVLGDPIAVGDGPRWVAVSPDGKRAFVTTGFFSADPGDVTAIDAASDEALAGPVEVGNAPLGVAIVPDQPPHAALASAAATAGEPVRLDASASGDPDGEIARYHWSFGDGAEATTAGPTPHHVYAAPGAYRPTVTATDAEGCSTAFVFTGSTASCNGSDVAEASAAVAVQAPPPPPPPPSNDFRRGAVHRDKQRGTARLDVWVPGPGALRLRGRRLRAQSAVASAAGTLALTVRPKRAAMKALRRRGHLRVGLQLTFSPDGGTPRTLTGRLTLVRG